MTDNEKVAQAMRNHHAKLVSDLQTHVELLIDDVTSNRDYHSSVAAVLAVLEDQIVPHAVAEESAIYPLGSRRNDLATLIDAMIGEHRYLQSAIATLRSASDGVHAAVIAQTIATVFQLHAGKENDYILSSLAADPGLDLGDALSDMHTQLESPSASNPQHDGTAGGVLDVRPLPPAARHQLIFSTFDSLPPGQSFELVNDHDPKPLRYQLSAEHPDQFDWEYLESGPTAWRVRIARIGA